MPVQLFLGRTRFGFQCCFQPWNDDGEIDRMWVYSLGIVSSVSCRVCLLAAGIISVENLSSVCVVGIRKELKRRFQALPFPEVKKEFFEALVLCRVLLFLLAQLRFV